MTDSQKLRDQTDRGERASVVLKELEAAFDALEKDCFAAFKNSDVHDDLGRTTCRLYLKVMDDVRTRFMAAVYNGEAARKELMRIKPKSVMQKVMNG